MQQICICEHSDASYCAYKDAFVAPRSVVGCGFKLSVSGEAASPRQLWVSFCLPPNWALLIDADELWPVGLCKLTASAGSLSPHAFTPLVSAFLAAATGRVAPPASSSSGASPATSIRQGYARPFPTLIPTLPILLREIEHPNPNVWSLYSDLLGD